MADKTPNEILKEQLCYAKKNALVECDDATIAEAFGFCDGYKKFLDAARTEREAVTEVVRLAKENGYFDCVGLHINLTEGKAMSKECMASELCDENGYLKGEFHKPFKARLYLKKSIRHILVIVLTGMH